MTSFAEKCLCWSVEMGWDIPSKILAFCGTRTPEAAYVAENTGRQELSFSLFPLGETEAKAMLEKAIISGDSTLVSFVCERYSFDDWEKALTLALKHKQEGLAALFIELGATKERHVSEFCASKDPSILLKLVEQKKEQSFLWDSFLQ
ncbi:hypothetical protein MarSH_241 [Marseillevirus Shanghai 1]|uniref:hypothetical protein n=1 Tax=Melbournevirus TaxID=1560514 RepID=UPI00051F5CBF|nr:hypothetical protein MEL_208 [Melbournevirus]AIT54821.1 hypothetical protein MEL_208 [Melbournevirus]AVR52946.1 hypothetical protein MarSH_241 [Marseillevirus Shanghai 1]